jgi:nitrogen PTS system EIIA component
MSHEVYSLAELARQLGRDRRELEKLVNRGRIPGRKVGGEWQFHQREITHWLEREMREYSERELAVVERSNQSEEVDPDVPITSLLAPEMVQVPLESRTKRSVLETLVEVAGRTWQIWEPATVLAAIQERETMHSTAFDNGLAIPHTRNPLPDSMGQSLVAYGRTLSGIPFGAPKGKLTDIFFLVLCCDSRTHLQVLARIGRLVQLPDFLDDLRAADDNRASYELILAADEKIGQENA